MKPLSQLSLVLTMALTGAITAGSSWGQPRGADSKPNENIWSLPAMTLPELEKLIGGRTKLTFDLKNATLAQYAAAINESTGLNLGSRPSIKRIMGQPDVERTYSFAAQDQPFWEAFLSWQRPILEAHKNDPARPMLVMGDRSIPRGPAADLGLFKVQKAGSEILLQNGQPINAGRTLANWPYVMVGTRLTRNQRGILTEEGLLAPENEEPVAATMAFAKTLTQQKKEIAEKEIAEEDRWLDSLMLDTTVYFDPKIEPLDLRCEIIEAIDDQGHGLGESAGLALSPNRIINSGEVGLSLDVPLAFHPHMGKKLVKLRGNLRFWVVTRTQHWETTDLTTPIGGTILRDGGGFNVQFKGISDSTNGPEVNFSAQSQGEHLRYLWNQARANTIIFGSGRGLEDNRIFPKNAFRVKVVDDKGQLFSNIYNGHTITIGPTNGEPIPGRQLGDSPLPDNTDTVRYTEDARLGFGQPYGGNQKMDVPVLGKIVKLIVDLPLERREVVLPFEFTDLPLPPS
jgi:hypothetical protein